MDKARIKRCICNGHWFVTDADLNEKINRAYLEKYDHGEGSFYAQGIIQPQHVDKTMEFEVQFAFH